MEKLDFLNQTIAKIKEYLENKNISQTKAMIHYELVALDRKIKDFKQKKILLNEHLALIEQSQKCAIN